MDVAAAPPGSGAAWGLQSNISSRNPDNLERKKTKSVFIKFFIYFSFLSWYSQKVILFLLNYFYFIFLNVYFYSLTHANKQTHN